MYHFTVLEARSLTGVLAGLPPTPTLRPVGGHSLPELSPSRVGGHFLRVSSHHLPTVPDCVLLSSHKNTSHTGLSPHLKTSFQLHTL